MPRSEPMSDGELLAVVSELVLGYREGGSGDIIQAIAGMKDKAMKYEASEQIDKLLELIDDLAETKDAILQDA